MDFEALENILRIKVDNDENYKQLLATAFTHRSYLNEHHGSILVSNERLEFLGDAVLQLVSSVFLYKKFPLLPEGDLTNYRSAMVCTPSLAFESKRLGYGAFLLLSKGEEATGGRNREYILANTFEAVLGALYTQNGLEFCQQFLERELLYKINNIVRDEKYKDAKSKFQELAQEKLGFTPEYYLIDSWGQDHDKTFKIQVKVGDRVFGVGEGKSKQRAEMEAAGAGLDKIISS
ncbi:ribonuclease III [candidate division WWE3 bacterium CG08_land_8_20_14_0_20_41_10]|uniref:Ribonuclease 3 n=1 Tax=candidate division WWE3 bacterium CG08_land_8_20_14_0_20_41_10 TaxID=1975085 RepID=A0A2H0XD28_UNCKA|nr:MAG: ribonuclease III [candidate division WWE3 bacterium CG08_land_8_20_14_0_20_41_10]